MIFQNFALDGYVVMLSVEDVQNGMLSSLVLFVHVSISSHHNQGEYQILLLTVSFPHRIFHRKVRKI